MKYVDTKCPHCGRVKTIEMTDEQFESYLKNEENIQNIFPNLTPEIREMLITGICPVCWNKIFKYEDD